MAKKRRSPTPVTRGSDNVFADLGFKEPDDELTKAQLSSEIRSAIAERNLTQAQAAAILDVDQPKVSALLNGRLANFSSERLMRLLTALGRDVDITIRPARGRKARGQIRVTGAA